MIFYFSGTGNSEWAARSLAAMCNDRVFSATEALGRSEVFCLGEDEALGFVFPVYGWAPPAIIVRLIEKLRLSAQPRYVYFVCTCGDDTGKTARLMRKALARRRWKRDAAFSLTMPNTYVCLPGFDVDSDELAQRKLSAARGRIADIACRINGRWRGKDCYEGALPWTKTYILGFLFKHLLMSPRRFKATDSCVKCGRCVKACPLHNVQMKPNAKPVWGENCAMCLSCYHHCPKHAIEYGRQTMMKGQYLFPEGSSDSEG